jgi:CheY-like chemotaxis protein
MAWNELRHRARVVRDYHDVPPVEANEGRLGQVFLNLILNAAQSLPDGDAENHFIKVATRAGDGLVSVEVADSGCGVPAAIRERVFEPFFTTKPIGVGTGLGLSICHSIVTRLGGRILIDSEEGKGTRITVELPLAQPTDAVSEPAPAPSPTQGRRGRVLVVDDEPMIGRMVERILHREHDVRVCSRAREALDWVTGGERFDLILCDVMMPDMTGMDLYAGVQRVSPEQAARMVFTTGGAFTQRAREFLETTNNLHLEKPFSLDQLQAIVRERVAQGS